ncbi:MAG TPA: hypothetical protein VJ793_21465 [Anaerolineae bacterium]|nr:hypothetical protein [Anaerolineae bacterium]
MAERIFDTSPTPHITVEMCGGDLSIAAADAPQVLVDLSRDDGDIQREGETLRVRTGGHCKITCPPGASITIEQVGGDLSAQDLKGTLAVQSAGGDVSLRGAGVVTIQSAGGDVSARDIAGDLRIEAIRGDLEVRRVAGQFIAANVGGDISARALGRGFDLSAACDMSLEPDIQAGETYRARAGCDLTLRVPYDASARFKLSAGGEIGRRIELSEWQGNSHAGQGAMGKGEAEVELVAGGDLMLLPARFKGDDDFGFNFDAIDSQIEAKMEQIERDLDTKMAKLNEQIARMAAVGAADLEARLSRASTERVTRHAERAAEHARRQAEHAAERARRQAERAAERARRRADRSSRWHAAHIHVDIPPRAARPSAPSKSTAPVTEAERLMILRMLEERKISVEEAGRLLDALEG